MNKLHELLNREVANLGVLYVKLHHFHWFVKGKLFFELHAKFEVLYDEITAHFDAVAERLLMINGKPASTLKEYLTLASIAEAKGNESTDEMIQSVIKDFEKLNEEFKEILKVSQDLGDEITVDLALGIQSSLEKHLWMLTTTLK